MKKFLFLFVCGFVLTVLFGCQEAAQSPERGVNVIIDGDAPFPEFLVGTWKDEKTKWEFTFEPDGTISTAVIDSGVVRAEPGKKIATAIGKDGSKAIYNLGRWTVQYSPASRELSVDIVVESFKMPLGEGFLGGSSTDFACHTN